MTSSGLEPATFKFETQRFNNVRHIHPSSWYTDVSDPCHTTRCKNAAISVTMFILLSVTV
jgi:hypothetical protein